MKLTAETIFLVSVSVVAFLKQQVIVVIVRCCSAAMMWTDSQSSAESSLNDAPSCAGGSASVDTFASIMRACGKNFTRRMNIVCHSEEPLSRIVGNELAHMDESHLFACSFESISDATVSVECVR